MFKKLIVCVAVLSTLPALAGNQTWDFTSGGSQLSSSGDGNSLSMVIDGVALTVSGWSDTNGISYVNGTPETIDEAELVYYGDTLGLINQDEDDGTPNHSIDSYDPNNNSSWGNDFDALMLTFSSEVILDGLDIGWAYEDYDTSNEARNADITTIAYTGNGSRNISGSTWQDISNSSAWSLVQNSSNVLKGDYYALTNQVKSTSFLISAYNPVFGTDGWSSLNDGFKLAGITTQTRSQKPPTDIPEPATFATFLLGLIAIRKLRKKVR